MKKFEYYDSGVEYTPLSIVRDRVYRSNYFNDLEFPTLSAKKREKERLEKIIKTTYIRGKNRSENIKREFINDLYKDLDIISNPKRDLLFQKSYELGFHEGGFEKVYNIAKNLVELIK